MVAILSPKNIFSNPFTEDNRWDNNETQIFFSTFAIFLLCLCCFLSIKPAQCLALEELEAEVEEEVYADAVEEEEEGDDEGDEGEEGANDEDNIVELRKLKSPNFSLSVDPFPHEVEIFYRKYIQIFGGGVEGGSQCLRI